MKINKIKINSYGKLKNKEINLENKIEIWTEIIFKYLKNINRKNINFTDGIKKYDIIKETTKLEKKYLNSYKRNEIKNGQN